MAYYYDEKLSRTLHMFSSYTDLTDAFNEQFSEEQMDLLRTLVAIADKLGEKCVPPELRDNNELRAIIDEDRDIRGQYMMIAIIASFVFGRYNAGERCRIFKDIRLKPHFNNGRKLYVEIDITIAQFYVHKNREGSYTLSYSNSRNQVYELAKFVINNNMEIVDITIPKHYGMSKELAHQITTSDGYPDTGYNMSLEEMWRQAAIRYVVNLVRDMVDNPKKYQQEDDYI